MKWNASMKSNPNENGLIFLSISYSFFFMVTIQPLIHIQSVELVLDFSPTSQGAKYGCDLASSEKRGCPQPTKLTRNILSILLGQTVKKAIDWPNLHGSYFFIMGHREAQIGKSKWAWVQCLDLGRGRTLNLGYMGQRDLIWPKSEELGVLGFVGVLHKPNLPIMGSLFRTKLNYLPFKLNFANQTRTQLFTT